MIRRNAPTAPAAESLAEKLRDAPQALRGEAKGQGGPEGTHPLGRAD